MSAPTTPNSISISQSSASRPSRPFSPSPPRDNIHTASRPPSLFLGAAVPSSPSVSGNRSFNILGLPDTPDSDKSSPYDGMPRHEISEDLFGYGDREIRGRKTSSRVGRPGEVDKTPAVAELATTRDSLSMVRSMSNGSLSSTSSSSPPLGSASILATLASDAEIPSIPPSSSRRLSGRSSGFSTPPPHANAPRSPNSAQTKRTSSPNPSSLSNSRSMPRLHQPTVVRSVSGKGVSFLPPPGRIVPSSSSASLARSRTTKGSTSARSSLPAVDGDKEDRARRYYSFNGGESSRPKPNSYLSDLGPPIRFPTPRAPVTGESPGGNKEDQAAEAMLQKGVIEVKPDGVREDVDVPTSASAVPYGINDHGLPGLDHGSGETSDRSTAPSRGESVDPVEEAGKGEPIEDLHSSGEDYGQIFPVMDTPNTERYVEEKAEIDRGAEMSPYADDALAEVASPSSSSAEPSEPKAEGNVPPVVGPGSAIRSTQPQADLDATELQTEGEDVETVSEVASLPRDTMSDEKVAEVHEVTGAEVSDPVWWVSVSEAKGAAVDGEERDEKEGSSGVAVDEEAPRAGEVDVEAEKRPVIGQDGPGSRPKVEVDEGEQDSERPGPTPPPPIASDSVPIPDGSASQAADTLSPAEAPSTETDIAVEDIPPVHASIVEADQAGTGSEEDDEVVRPRSESPAPLEVVVPTPVAATPAKEELEPPEVESEESVVDGGDATEAASAKGPDVSREDGKGKEGITETGAAEGHILTQEVEQEKVVENDEGRLEQERSQEESNSLRNVNLPRVVSQETILHEITDDEIDPSMLASIGELSTSTESSESGTIVYIPPYQPRKPAGNRTYRLPTPASTPAVEDKFAVTLLAGIARQSRADALSLTIPHVELYLAWSEPRSWLWVPARKYIPAFDLRLVGSGKEVVLHDPVANERREEAERRQGLVRGVVRGVVGRLPIVWRFAGWV